MDRFTQYQMFAEVVKQQGFAPAARALGVTTSAVSKSLQTLENDLAVRLLNRTTRQLSLTHEGAIYYERVLRILEDVSEADQMIRETHGTPQGVLKVNAPLTFGVQYLSHLFAQYAQTFPDIALEVDFDDRYVDVVQEGYDLVIRIAALPDSTLISRKLCDAPIHWVASPDYIAQHGMPATPKELKKHRIIGYTRHGHTMDWKHKTPEGKTGSLSLSPHNQANNGEMMLALALAGVGVALIPQFILDTHPESHSLTKLLEEYPLDPPRHVYAVFSQKKHLSLKVRTLLEFLGEALSR